MTLPRLAAFGRYWQNNPPLHQLVAAYFGVESKPENSRTAEENCAALFAALGG